MASLKIYTAAGDNCLTLTEVKNELKVESSDEDSVLAMKLDAAERLIEEYTNRRLMKAVYEYTLSGFPHGELVLPLSPVISVDSIKYYDSANVQQTWAATNYWLDLNEEPTVIRWSDAPTTYDDRRDVVTVRFTVGYSNEVATATQQAAVPPSLKQAILKLVGDLAAYRQDAPRERFTSWKMMAYPFRVFHFPGENDRY